MTTQVVLSVAEALVLVGVLIFFLRRIDALLVHIYANLGKITEGVAAVEGHCAVIGPGADEINRLLGQTAGGLTRAAEEAEALA